MADFIEQTVTRTAVRNLAVPIADVSSFNTILSEVIVTNPFGCTGYDVGGIPQDAVIKSDWRERVTERLRIPVHSDEQSASAVCEERAGRRRYEVSETSDYGHRHIRVNQKKQPRVVGVNMIN